MSTNSTTRFTDRVQNYIKYRPDYPAAVLSFISSRTGLTSSFKIADIGSGTGIFTKQLLNAGYNVYAVEPNEQMRDAADTFLEVYPKYSSINGSSNHTTLTAHTMDLIVCAQAFHWFNTPETKAEFQRILVNDAYVALIWNKRITQTDEFSKAYDELLRQKSVDYNEVNHQNLNASDFEAFFKDAKYEKVSFPNVQVFDEEGFIGRAYSSSYVPAESSEEGKTFLKELKNLFDTHQQNGKISFYYETEIYIGQV